MLDAPVGPAPVVDVFAGDGFSGEMADVVPGTRLAGVAEKCSGYRETTAVPFDRREVPTGSVVMIIGFGASLDMTRGGSTDRLTAFVAGLDDTPVITRFAGTQQGIELRVDPFTAGRLLGRPLADLANQVVALDVVDPAMRSWPERLAEVGTWAERFAVLDVLLHDRLGDDRSVPVDPAIRWAWQQLVRSDGQVRIGVLADEIGWSRRHFAARFDSYLGLTPKRAARVLRYAHSGEVSGDYNGVVGYLAAAIGTFDAD